MPKQLTDEEARRRLSKNFNGTITALEPYRSNRERWGVKCVTCGNKWSPYPPNLLQKKKLKGCQACYHRTHALTDEQARARLNPTFTPLEPYPGSGRRNWQVICKRGHRSNPKAAILVDGCGCRKCLNEDMALTDEEARSRIFKLHNGTVTPMEPYPGAAALPWKMKCECGHEWAKSLSHLGKWGCQKCAWQKISLTDEEARRRLFDYFGDKITVLEPYPGSWERNWLVACNQCGKEWSPTANSLLVGSGCPNCAEYGFQLAKSAITYYIRISAPCGYLYKIGVTNLTVKQRYRAESVKVDVVEIWSFKTGAEALQLETEILQKNEAHRYEGPMIFRYCKNDEIFTRDVLGLDNLEEQSLSLMQP
jgi:predicted  nucleic acid-binding Zn-ribbon protein